MQGPVHKQGATYFNVEFDCGTVHGRIDLTGRNTAAREDLELRAPADAGIFDVSEGGPVYVCTGNRLSKKRGRIHCGSYPLVLSSLNGLQYTEVGRDKDSSDKLDDSQFTASRFFDKHSFFGIAVTPCHPDLNRRNHFVVARQGLVSLRVAADTVAGDRIVVDFPCHHTQADDGGGAGTTPCTSVGKCRLKKTLIFRPQRFSDVRSFSRMRANKMKKLLNEIKSEQGLNETSEDTLLCQVEQISRLCELEIGVAVSNASKGQLAKVVIHSSCF